MSGKKIREFLRDLFGSRLVETMQNNFNLMLAHKELEVSNVQAEMARLRNDFELRIQDKDNLIADLRTEKAMLAGKCHLYETTLMPLSSRAGATVVAAGKPRDKSALSEFPDLPPIKTRWQQMQEAHDAEIAKEIKQEQEQTKSVLAQGSALGAK